MKFFVGTILLSLCATALAIIFYAMIHFGDQSRISAETQFRTVGVVLKAMDSEHWLSVRSSMLEAAQANHMRLIVMSAENEAAFEEQNKIIEDLLQNDIDALIVSTTNIHHTENFIRLAQKKGIPIFSIDEAMDGIPYIGSDNYLIGQMAAKYFAQHLPAGAKVNVLSGSANQNAHIQRTQGFVDYIRENTDLQLGICLADDTKYRQAMIQIEKMLQEHPDTRGIFITSAIMTLGAIEVTEKISPHIQIVGVDTQNDAITALKQGKIDAMISQDGHESGKLAIEVVNGYLNNQSAADFSYIKNELITLDNADEFLLQEDF